MRHTDLEHATCTYYSVRSYPIHLLGGILFRPPKKCIKKMSHEPESTEWWLIHGWNIISRWTPIKCPFLAVAPTILLTSAWTNTTPKLAVKWEKLPPICNSYLLIIQTGQLMQDHFSERGQTKHREAINSFQQKILQSPSGEVKLRK